MTPFKLTAAASCLALLGGCATIDKLANVGQAPQLTAIQDPTVEPGYQPVSMPMPASAKKVW